MAENARRRSWLQFSLRTFFWLILVVAIGIVAYRRGFDAGLADAVNQRTQVGNVFAMVYHVSDAVPMKQVGGKLQLDYRGLVSDLTSEVLPNTWIERGGTAAIKEFPENSLLVVSHDQDGHERIAKYLAKRRRSSQTQQLTAK